MSGASNQVISLPKGGGALQGIGEKFSPDLHTGTGNFSVPIALPQMTSRATSWKRCGRSSATRPSWRCWIRRLRTGRCRPSAWTGNRRAVRMPTGCWAQLCTEDFGDLRSGRCDPGGEVPPGRPPRQQQRRDQERAGRREWSVLPRRSLLPADLLDYRTIAEVLITIDYTWRIQRIAERLSSGWNAPSVQTVHSASATNSPTSGLTCTIPTRQRSL
jgi:hypothetical protein